MFSQRRDSKTAMQIVPSSMETGKLGPTQQTMEYVSHLMEERDNIVVSHQCWLVGCWFGKVSDHGSKGVATLSTRQVVARKERPNSGVRVLRS